MFKSFLSKYIGNGSRFQMTIIYIIISMILWLTKTMESVSFATFSGIYGAWIASEHFRPHDKNIN